MTRVLCYSPYNRWPVHGQWDMTIAHGLRNRGADVRYVMCDGLFSDCDVLWASLWGERPADACLQCQAGVARLAADNQMPYEWLGRSLDPKESREARRWVAGLTRDELVEARYGDWRIAEWVRGSVHSHLRRSRLDVADPAVERTLRSYLYSGLIAAFALTRLLDDFAPDVLLVFNARQSSTRVAFELARSRGIRVVCHERGPRNGTMRLTANRTIIAREQWSEYWEQWGEIPLTPEERDAITAHLAEREAGRNTGCVAFSPAPQALEEVRAALRLRADRPAWVLFTSSDDEVAAEPDWHGELPQTEWVRETIEYARAHPEIDLVVRLHPNTGSRRSIGVNQQQLDELAALRAGLPDNVRWIEADDEVSSYTLMELATVGLISHSTVGLELAAKGKRVIASAYGIVTGASFVRSRPDLASYLRELDEALALAPGHVDRELRRLGLRYAYGFWFRQPVEFPLVSAGQGAEGARVWRDPSELVPGRDAGLDRATAIVLDGDPVCRPPGAAERAREPERVVVAASAEELIADVSLLALWRDAVAPGDPVTLVIDTPVHATEALVAAVTAAGLDGEAAPDMLAVAAGDPALDAAVHVLSHSSTAADLQELARGARPAGPRAIS